MAGNKRICILCLSADNQPGSRSGTAISISGYIYPKAYGIGSGAVLLDKGLHIKSRRIPGLRTPPHPQGIGTGFCAFTAAGKAAAIGRIPAAGGCFKAGITH